MPQQTQHQQVRPHLHPRAATAQQTSLERHRRKCAVCHHPEREAIEEEFLHWHNPVNIVHEFDLGDRRILYRHAHATGLYDQRRRNYLFTIENVLECGDDIDFTAAAYIKAVRAYACLCDTVRWTEPVTRVLHDYHVHTDSGGHVEPPTSDSAAGSCSGSPDGAPRSTASRAWGSRQAGAGTASSLPQAASNKPATAASRQARRQPDDAHSVDESQATNHAPAKNQQAGASPSAGPVSSADSGEKFLAAAIPLLGAKPKHVAQLKKAGLLHLAELAARHVSPPSNRHNLELESPVTPTKQTSEAISNRHKIAK